VSGPTILSDAMARDLGRILDPGRVLRGPAAERAYDCDAYTVDRSKPSVVVLPESTAEVAGIVRWCVANGVPFTPRGAGTGLSGGTMPALGGVVVSIKRMNRILRVDVPNRRLLAQSGVVNQRISDAVAGYGLHFAPDPSSQTVSTLGGNIAENAGGPHTLKYGVTCPHILGLTLVDPAGEVMAFRQGPGYDLLGLLIGSEGCMGIVTEAWVKLTPNPKAVKTALAAFPTVRGATQSVAAIVASGVVPAALEMMDRGILKALRAAFDLRYPHGTDALLLVEVDGDPKAVEAEMETVARIMLDEGALSVAVAQDEAERKKMWTARKKGIGAMGRLAPSIVTHDGVIPRSKLPEMLDYVYAVAGEYGLGVANLFHAGDGNLHPCFYFDDRDAKQVAAVVEAGEAIMRHCVELGGSLTGEHGIGVEKLDLMRRMFAPEDLELQARAKGVFNDGDLCNPCKVLPDGKGCIEHRKRWRGAAN
jgi:glycolate oxidase subunit GlcD